MSRPEVRPASTGDLADVCCLRLAFLAEHRGVGEDVLGGGFAVDTEAFVRRRHGEGSAWSWLAIDGGRATGVVTLLRLEMPPHPDDPREADGYVVNLYVEPAVRGRGIGRRLLDACVEGAATVGVRRVLLQATDDGLPLYLTSGFSVDDRLLYRSLPLALP